LIDLELLQPSLYAISDNIVLPSLLNLYYAASLNAYIKINGEKVFIIGQTNKPFSSKISLDKDSIAIKLGIGLIKKLFGIPTSKFTNQIVSLSEIKNNSYEEKILCEIEKINDVHHKRFVIEKILKKNDDECLFDLIIKRICNEAIYKVKDLCSIIGYSERHLQRIMLLYTGFTTKEFLTLLRFERSKLMINRLNDEMSSIAYDNDYFDQSHFIKDFNKYSGYSPKQYKTTMSDFYNPEKTFYVRLIQ